MRFGASALIVGILVSLVSCSAPEEHEVSQPSSNRVAARLSVEPGSLQSTYLKILWTYDHNEELVGIYYDKGILLIETASKRLVRLDPQNGRPYLNRLRLSEKLRFPPVVYLQGTPAAGSTNVDEIFIIQRGDRLSCVEADSMLELWAEDVDYGLACAPCITRDMIFLSAAGGRLNGVHKEDRTEEWAFLAGKTCSAPPVLGQTDRVMTPASKEAAGGAPGASAPEADFLYVASEDGRVYRLNVYLGWKGPGARGGQSWEGATKAEIVTSPVSYQQRVFVASLDYSLYAFEDVDGSRAWKYHVGRDVREQPFAYEDTIFVLAEESPGGRRTLYAVASADGKCRWKRTETASAGDRYQEDGLPCVEKFLAPGKELVYVLAQDTNEVWGVRYNDGKILHRVPLTQRPDFVVSHDANHGRDGGSRGLIFMAAENGRVLALKERRVY